MKRVLGMSAALGVGMLAGPAAAANPNNPWCCGAKFTATFSDSAPEVQILTAALFAVALAAPVLWGLALARSRKGQGNSMRTLAFLGAWRVGSLPLAAAGIAYLAMNFFVAVYAYPPVKSYHGYAPGFAEMSMVLWAGLMAAAATTLAHAHLKARLPAAP